MFAILDVKMDFQLFDPPDLALQILVLLLLLHLDLVQLTLCFGLFLNQYNDSFPLILNLFLQKVYLLVQLL